MDMDSRVVKTWEGDRGWEEGSKGGIMEDICNTVNNNKYILKRRKKKEPYVASCDHIGQNRYRTFPLSQSVPLGSADQQQQ